MCIEALEGSMLFILSEQKKSLPAEQNLLGGMYFVECRRVQFSPVLFNIDMRRLNETDQSCAVGCYQYADDTQL